MQHYSLLGTAAAHLLLANGLLRRLLPPQKDVAYQRPAGRAGEMGWVTERVYSLTAAVDGSGTAERRRRHRRGRGHSPFATARTEHKSCFSAFTARRCRTGLGGFANIPSASS